MILNSHASHRAQMHMHRWTNLFINQISLTTKSNPTGTIDTPPSCSIVVYDGTTLYSCDLSTLFSKLHNFCSKVKGWGGVVLRSGELSTCCFGFFRRRDLGFLLRFGLESPAAVGTVTILSCLGCGVGAPWLHTY